MVGVIADASRYGRTAAAFQEIFDECTSVAKDGLRELKASDLLYGNGKWRRVHADERKDVMSQFVNLAAQRKHHLALTAIDTVKANSIEGCPDDLPDSNWQRGALHIALQVQRAHMGKDRGKGTTLLVFDEHREASAFSDLLLDPPRSTEAYYGRPKRQPPLSCIMDTAMAVKSHHFGMVQLADIYAFIFRRHAELVADPSLAKWPGEVALIESWIERLTPRLLKQSHRWPKRPASDLGKWYCSVAPEALSQLNA